MDRSEFQPQEVSTGREAAESMETRGLEEATFDSLASLERMGEYQQAEEIQTRFESVMASVSTAKVPVGEVSATPITLPIPVPEEEVSATPITLPMPVPVEEVSATPITLPIPRPEEEVSTMPIPIPYPEDEIGAKGQIKGTEGTTEMPLPGTAGEQVGIDPIPVPREADLASSAGGVAGSGAEGVGITPINLPREADMASSAGGVAGSGAEGVGITPINLPREANVVSDGIEGVMGGSAVAASGLKGPGGDGVASGEVKGPGGEGVASGVGKGPGGDPVETGFEFFHKEPGGAGEVPLPGTAGESRTFYVDRDNLEKELSSINDDGKLANLDLQATLEEQQQIEAMLSNLLKDTSETAQSIIKNMKA